MPIAAKMCMHMQSYIEEKSHYIYFWITGNFMSRTAIACVESSIKSARKRRSFITWNDVNMIRHFERSFLGKLVVIPDFQRRAFAQKLEFCFHRFRYSKISDIFT